MGILVINAGGQDLILTSAENIAGETVVVYDDPGMVDSDSEASPPVVGDEVTLPYSFNTDQELYLYDGPVAVIVTQADGTTLVSDQVLVSSGVGAVATLTPVPTFAQVSADVYGDRTADTAAFAAKATLTAKGSIYAASAASTPAALAVGTNGKVLTAASGETTGLKWDTAVATGTTWAAKGDIVSATASSTLAALTVGANGTALLADSGEATGLKYGAVVRPDVASGGSTKVLASGGIGVGNSATATTTGTVVKKIEVFDATGASLGFVAVYDAIT